MSTNEELIGREDLNDLEAILAVTNTDRDEVIHAVKDNAKAIFTWDYEKGARPALNRLYEKAKVSMWNGETDLPWETEVDQEKVVLANAAAGGGFDEGVDLTGTGTASRGSFVTCHPATGVLDSNAMPYSAADFEHGPLALAEPGLPVLAIAPAGTQLDAQVALLTRLREDHGARLLVVSDSPAARAIDEGLPLPDGIPPWLGPIIEIVPAQLYAYRLTVARGLDPEHPRSIHKVTETR